MVERVDEDMIVTVRIDRMIQAIVDRMPLDDDDRLKVEIALCKAIAETYSERARLLGLLLNKRPSVS